MVTTGVLGTTGVSILWTLLPPDLPPEDEPKYPPLPDETTVATKPRPVPDEPPLERSPVNRVEPVSVTSSAG